MFLEGEVDWVLVLSITAAVSVLIALVSLWFAVTHTRKHATASDQLDLVQKVAEAADTRLFQILNALPVALVETDKQGKFVFANRAAHQLLGRRDAELLGLRFHSATWGITYPDGRPIPPDLLPSARALRGQTVKGFQHVLANPANRKKMLVSVTAMPIEDEWGQVIGSTAALIETESLTTPGAETIEAAAAPSSADDLTRRVFEAASSALVVVGRNGAVLEANPVARLLAGAGQDVVGADFAEVFLGDAERLSGWQTLRSALSPAGTDQDMIEAPGAGDGGVRWRLLRLAAEGEQEDVLLLAGERMDIAAETPQPEPGSGAVVAIPEPDAEPDESEALAALRAQAEAAVLDADTLRAELAAAQTAAVNAAQAARVELEAGRRMEAVGRLTGGVAHDFNALLAVMTSAIDMMLKQADDASRVRRLGQAALAAGQRGEALTRRLTAFSQGDDEPALQVLDAGVLLRGLESRLRAEAGTQVDLLIEGPSEPAPVRLDPVAFEGAVRALVRNAIEASDPPMSIAVRLERLEDGGARLSVRDAGAGMTADTVARASEPFFTTREGQAGLGLSQVYAFARQSGGDMTIGSAPGEGSEVVVTLPAA